MLIWVFMFVRYEMIMFKLITVCPTLFKKELCYILILLSHSYPTMSITVRPTFFYFFLEKKELIQWLWVVPLKHDR